MVEYVVIGEVLGGWGKEGEIRVLPITDNPERFKTLKKFYVTLLGGGVEAYNVKRVKKSGKYYIIKAVPERGEEKTLKRGTLIKVHISDVPPAEEGSYYYFQIEGLTVETEDGEYIGVVKRIMTTPSNDIFIVEGRGG
ncbi:MAG: 16S rRNA processing protein RimM, partial [Nitrospirae bacterium]